MCACIHACTRSVVIYDTDSNTTDIDDTVIYKFGIAGDIIIGTMGVWTNPNAQTNTLDMKSSTCVQTRVSALCCDAAWRERLQRDTAQATGRHGI